MRKKLILFDIDGTLVLTGGLAGRLMVESISRVLGKPIQWNILDFVGNTDRNIIRTLLRRNGATEPMLEDLAEDALKLYLERLREEIQQDQVIRVLPGVRELLGALENDPRFVLGLLTGNMREGARLKLEPVGLHRYFPVGAFGDDALKRNELPPFALQRAEKYYQCFFEPKDIWIVGDSANDIKCAHANHLRCLAVGTGHLNEAELKKYQPDALLPDLSSTERVIQILSE